LSAATEMVAGTGEIGPMLELLNCESFIVSGSSNGKVSIVWVFNGASILTAAGEERMILFALVLN